MKFSIEKKVLLENLTHVSKAISSKNIIPVLNGIMFDLTKEGLYLTASDSELTIKSFIEAKEIKNIEAEGKIIIQSKYIIDIIRKMPTDIINIELIDGLKLIIYSDVNQYDLNCLDPKEYPTLKIEESKNPITLNTELFKSIIKETSFAISTQESRPLLTGVNLKINGNILECIATDSYRLSKKTIKLDNKIEDNINIVIPGKNLNELDKILTDDENLEIHIFNNKALFKYKNILFQTSLLSGTYPDTSNLIPKDFKIIVNTKISQYYDAIDRAALLTISKERNIVKMRLQENQIIINSFASEIGKVEETLQIERNNNDNLDISFSATYMLEALKVFKDDDIHIMLNDDNSAIVLKSVKDETLIQLILPIKTY